MDARAISSLPTAHCESKLAAEILAEEALSAGIDAVMSAMSGETRFTNENEAAFALLRKGCRHSARSEAMPLRLVIPEQQAVVVSFLVRVADRRSAARRVKELGRILLKASPSWQHLLMNAEQLGGVSGLLSEEVKALGLKAEGDDAVPLAVPVIQAESRVFLRESQTQRHLSTASSHSSVVMTELPVSLFVCHSAGKGASEFSSCSTEAEEATSKRSELKPGSFEFGLEHEGIPSLGHFLGSRRRWTDLELCCSSSSLGKREIFRLSGASMQHQLTGMCLHVDPSCPNKVVLSAESNSAWEVLAAI